MKQKYVEELVNKVLLKIHNNINYDKSFEDSTHPDDKQKITCPRCFIQILKGAEDRGISHLPLCNRYNLFDPSIIDLSLKIAQKIEDFTNYDQDEINQVIKKLQSLKKKYDSDIPSTDSEYASIKGKNTKHFNAIKRKVKTIRN